MISLTAALIIIAGVTAFRLVRSRRERKKVPVEDIHGAEASRSEPHQGDAPLPK